MAETPKDRRALEDALAARFLTCRAPYHSITNVLEDIEALGVRLMPEEPTSEITEAMRARMRDNRSNYIPELYRAAIAANPFAPPKHGGGQ
jgi:hypothetical protein